MVQFKHVVIVLVQMFMAAMMAANPTAAPCLAAESASGAATGAVKPVKLRIGYVTYPSVECRSADPCRPDLAAAEAEYFSYMDECERQLQAARQQGMSADDRQKLVLQTQAGFSAREKLFGRCPGRCVWYDFPENFRHAAGDVARSKVLDVVIDVTTVFCGADVVLTRGMDLNALMLQRVKTYKR